MPEDKLDTQCPVKIFKNMIAKGWYPEKFLKHPTMRFFRKLATKKQQKQFVSNFFRLQRLHTRSTYLHCCSFLCKGWVFDFSPSGVWGENYVTTVFNKVVARFDLDSKGAHSRRHRGSSLVAVAGESICAAARTAHTRQKDVKVMGGYQAKHGSETFAIGKAFQKDRGLLQELKEMGEYSSFCHALHRLFTYLIHC